MTYNYLLGLWGNKKGGGLAIDVSSEPVFLSKKRRISMDVSSGLIFLKKKKKNSIRLNACLPVWNSLLLTEVCTDTVIPNVNKEETGAECTLRYNPGSHAIQMVYSWL